MLEKGATDVKNMIKKHATWINGGLRQLPNRLHPRPSASMILGLVTSMSTYQDGSDELDLEWIPPLAAELQYLQDPEDIITPLEHAHQPPWTNDHDVAHL